MMIQLGLFLNRNSLTELFESFIIITILCSVIASPIDRKNEDSLLTDSRNSEAIFSERQKIISELKSKLMSRLNISYVQKPNRTFDWTKIPDEMKSLLNQELMTQENIAENANSNIETLIATPSKISSCNDSSVMNQRCLDLKMRSLDNKEIMSAKLIVPLTQSSFENSLRDDINYSITINRQPEFTFYLSQVSNTRNDIVLDWTRALKTLFYDIDDGEDLNHIQNTLLLTVSISGHNYVPPVEQIIDLSKIVLEIQYKSAPKLSRKKRNANECKSNQFFCCTEKLQVSIEDLGYSDIILAPRVFQINYCRGDCNTFITYSSNHARAINYVRKRGMESRRELRSCCVPYSYQSLTIMYLNSENQLAVAAFNDLIASSCGCL